MAELLKQTKQYRAESEVEAKKLIEDAYETSKGIVDHKQTHKIKKDDEFWIVDITEKF